ncbi:MAG: sigma-70 family RNA polymerase sigma factor [Planctomycetales bacterium]
MTEPEIRDPERNDVFLELLARHRGQLFGYIYALVQNLHDADELFQKTTIVLWKKFGEFQPESDFMAWACRAAKLEMCNYVRSRGRDRHVFSDALLEQLAESQRDRSEHMQQRSAALDSRLSRDDWLDPGRSWRWGHVESSRRKSRGLPNPRAGPC